MNETEMTVSPEETLAEDGTRPPNQSSRLSRKDWIDAAWKALAHGSIETIKVDRLATQLNVSRGSFYWHFKSKKDLIDAVLGRWLERLGVHEAIEPILSGSASAEEKLWAINEYVIRTVNGPQSIFLRIWARKSPQVLSRMQREDDMRVDHYRRLFLEAGFDEKAASEHAEAYFAFVMSEYLRNGRLPMKERLEKARRFHDFVCKSKVNG